MLQVCQVLYQLRPQLQPCVQQSVKYFPICFPQMCSYLNTWPQVPLGKIGESSLHSLTMVWQGPSSRIPRILFSHYIQISKMAQGQGLVGSLLSSFSWTPLLIFFFLMAKSEYYLCWLLIYFAFKDCCCLVSKSQVVYW